MRTGCVGRGEGRAGARGVAGDGRGGSDSDGLHKAGYLIVSYHIQAAPLAGYEDLFDVIDGVAAFADGDRLAGIVRLVTVPQLGRRIAFIVRADAAIGATGHADRRRATSYSSPGPAS